MKKLTKAQNSTQCTDVCFLMCQVPFLPGETDLDQLDKTFQALGTPSVETWPVSIRKALINGHCR